MEASESCEQKKKNWKYEVAYRNQMKVSKLAHKKNKNRNASMKLPSGIKKKAGDNAYVKFPSME